MTLAIVAFGFALAFLLGNLYLLRDDARREQRRQREKQAQRQLQHQTASPAEQADTPDARTSTPVSSAASTPTGHSTDQRDRH